MKHIRYFLFCLLTICVCHLYVAADTPNPVVPNLGDRLGEHLDLVAAVFLGAAVVIIAICVVSVIRRK